MNKEIIAAATAFLALAEAANDRTLVKELTAARDSAVAEIAKLAGLQEQQSALTRARNQFERERDAQNRLLQTDRQALEKDRADLKRERDRHLEHVALFDRDRAQFDSQHKEFQRFQAAINGARA